MQPNLATTNVLLGIMAAVSVLEALLLVSVGVAGFLVYRRVMRTIGELEARQIAPAMARVNAILDDLNAVSAKVKDEAERVDTALRTTMDRVDDTAERVRTRVKAQTGRMVGILRGARVAIESMLGPRAV